MLYCDGDYKCFLRSLRFAARRLSGDGKAADILVVKESLWGVKKGGDAALLFGHTLEGGKTVLEAVAPRIPVLRCSVTGSACLLLPLTLLVLIRGRLPTRLFELRVPRPVLLVQLLDDVGLCAGQVVLLADVGR